MNEAEHDLLKRTVQGQLHVCHESLKVSYYHQQRKRWYVKSPDQHPVSGRYRFRFGPKRLTVYRNRLVWLYFKRTPIPSGHVIDHIDGDNQNDHPSNLQLHTYHQSWSQGNQVQLDKVLEELSDYFLTCGFLGHDPEDEPPANCH